MFCACIILSSGVKCSLPQVSVKALCVCRTVTESALGTAALFKTPDLHAQGQSVWDTVWTEQKITSVVLGMLTCLVITAQLEGLERTGKEANESLPACVHHLAWCPCFPRPGLPSPWVPLPSFLCLSHSWGSLRGTSCSEQRVSSVACRIGT